MEQEGIIDVWRKHFEKVSNEEFDWERDSLDAALAVSGPAEAITVHEVRVAIAKMKARKAVGPSGIGAEMLLAAGRLGCYG